MKRNPKKNEKTSRPKGREVKFCFLSGAFPSRANLRFPGIGGQRLCRFYGRRANRVLLPAAGPGGKCVAPVG